jgi:putative methionine-R-sulfoxide reductase with GAF domain
MNITKNHILNQIESWKKTNANWEDLLADVLTLFDCVSGTIHVLNPDDNLLTIKAYMGMPDHLLPIISKIPVGKGMAGIAAQRKEAVQVCNLQTDASGVVRPGAKDTKLEGAVTLPLMYENILYGTLGIAKSVPYEFSEAEIEDLTKIGNAICKKLLVEN